MRHLGIEDFGIRPHALPIAKLLSAFVGLTRFATASVSAESFSSLGGLVCQISAMVQGDKPGLRYRLKGQLSIGNGMHVPFDQRGEIDLSLAGP